MSRKLSMPSTVVALWLGALHPAMLIASCPQLQQQRDHGCCPREAPMPDCPASQCFTAPDRASLPAIVVKSAASAALEPPAVAFSTALESRIIPRAVNLPHFERDIYLKIRVLLI